MPDSCYFGRVLSCRQYTSVAGLCALGNFQLYHSHLWQRRFFCKQAVVKITFIIPAAKIAGTYLPYNIAALVQVVLANAALAGIMCKIA